MKINKKLSVLVILGLTSCSVNTPLTGSLNKSDDVKIVNLNKSVDKLKLQPQLKEQYLNIDVGQAKSGASFSIKIDSNQKISNFSTKANESGSLGKTSADVQSYEVYLVRNAQATYPTNGDPIGEKVAGPFNVNSNGTSASTITFTNVGDSQGQYYYVALRALDGANASGNNLIKVNNNWTGTTATTPYNSQVAVSTNGVTVSSAFVVEPITTININPDLIDAVGAKIEANVTVNNGVLPAATLTGRNNLGDLRVNTYTLDDQQNTSVASDNNGNFIVTWQSNGQDVYGDGIYAQRYNSNGTVNGSEFRVNTTVLGDQRNPSVAMDSDGDFVIAWQSSGQDGYGDGIYAQRYNSNAQAQGNEFLVNTFISGNQSNPSVAIDDDGEFIVTWQSRGQNNPKYGVYAQRYNADGSKPAVNGNEFQVNTYNDTSTSSSQLNPSVAMDSAGDFVITWQSGSYNGSGQDGNKYGIYAQRYNATGQPEGNEFQVNTTTSSFQNNPSVAMDNSGNFVISWQSKYQDGGKYGVYAQRYNADGSKPVVNGNEFQVNTYTSNRQDDPSVAMDNDGDFVVSWNSANQDGSSSGVYTRRYDTNGTAKDTTEFLVNTYTSDNQSNPNIAIDNDGDFVVTWQSYSQDGSQNGIYLKRYNSSGVGQ